MQKLSAFQEAALIAMDGEAHDEQTYPATGRTMNSLLRKGLVSWDAISPDTYGGYKLTPLGEKVRESLI
jgi:hypothetical protein